MRLAARSSTLNNPGMVKEKGDLHGQAEAVAPSEPAPSDASLTGSSPKRTATVESLSRWLGSPQAQEALTVLSLCALCVLIKVLWLTHIDVYWDAGTKWHFARQWSYANDFSHTTWSHHMARFGVNVPTYIVQKLLGTSVGVYYVWPVASFTLQTLLTYLLARRLSGRTAAVIAALLLIFFTGLTRSASQLLPDGLSGTAAMLAAYAFARFHEASGRARLRWLVVVGLGCIWAYMIKESSVLMFPGIGVAVLLSRRSLKEGLIFGGVFFAYVALETAGFRLFTPYAHRLAIVQEGHGFYQPITFSELVLNRFTKLDAPFQLLFLVGTPALVYQGIFGDKRSRLLVLFPVGFVFFLTFLIRSVDPLLQWVAFKPRYMAPVAPFLMVAIALVPADVVTKAWRRWARPGWQHWPSQLQEQAGAITFMLCLLLGVYQLQQARSSFGKHPLTMIKREAAILNDAYRRNLPIVERAKLPAGADAIYGPRGLNTAYAVYLDDAALAKSSIAKPGWLPDVTQAVRLPNPGEKYSYLLREPAPYQKDNLLKRYISDGCAVVVTSRGRVALSNKSALPQRCVAPSGT